MQQWETIEDIRNVLLTGMVRSMVDGMQPVGQPIGVPGGTVTPHRQGIPPVGESFVQKNMNWGNLPQNALPSEQSTAELSASGSF